MNRKYDSKLSAVADAPPKIRGPKICLVSTPKRLWIWPRHKDLHLPLRKLLASISAPGDTRGTLKIIQGFPMTRRACSAGDSGDVVLVAPPLLWSQSLVVVLAVVLFGSVAVVVVVNMFLFLCCDQCCRRRRCRHRLFYCSYWCCGFFVLLCWCCWLCFWCCRLCFNFGCCCCCRCGFYFSDGFAWFCCIYFPVNLNDLFCNLFVWPCVCVVCSVLVS